MGVLFDCLQEVKFFFGLVLHIGFGGAFALHSPDGGGYVVGGEVIMAMVPFLGEAKK